MKIYDVNRTGDDMRAIMVSATAALLLTAACSTKITTGSSVLSSIDTTSLAISDQEIKLSKGGSRVTMHPDGRLLGSDYCSSMVTTRVTTSYGFDNTIVALRNRAATVGGNAISIKSWVTVDDDAVVTAKFYFCNSKANL